MEINKLGELYTKLCQKYSYQSIDKDNDGNITEAEILSMVYQDTDLKAELDEADLELIKDFISADNSQQTSTITSTVNITNSANINNVLANLNNSDIQQLLVLLCTLLQSSGLSGEDLLSKIQSGLSVSDVQNTSSTNIVKKRKEKQPIKTMEEYTEILNNKFDELWEKFNGDSDSVIQYMKNNLGEYMDVTGDGRVDKIDLQIFDNYLKTLPKCSSSDPVEQEKGRAYTKGIRDFTSELRKQTYIITSTLNDKNSYTLEDVENYVKLGGNASMLKRNLDITSIAQEENWRERLLAAGYPESELRIYKYDNDKYNGDLYNRIIKAQEFINNNPDKVGYAAIASSYMLFADKNIYDIAKTDINNDGKFDAKDLSAFSTNIDLDGDGTVSNEEITFLKKVKEQMENFIYKDITTKSISNNASIDDIITYYDSVGNNADMSEKFAQAMNSFNTLKGNDKVYNTDPATGVTGLTDRGLLILLNNIGYAAQKAVRFGLQDGTSPIAPQSTWSTYNPDGEVKNIITQAINQASPANTYLHYVQSADLSKEQLTDILNKINSASASVQSKLAEVKTAVEQKLEAMS